MEKLVSLKFPDKYLLWGFAQTLDSESIEIDTKNKTLMCNCFTEDIATAIVDFKAKVIGELMIFKAR